MVAGRSRGDVFVGGSARRHLRDMNFEKDRKSFSEALIALQRAKVPVTFVGFRAALNADVPASFRHDTYLPGIRSAWARKARLWFGGELPPFDLVAAMMVTSLASQMSCYPVRVAAGRNLTLTRAPYSGFSFCE